MQGPFGGLTVCQIEPGTEVVDPDTGETLVVDDDSVVTVDGKIYVTPKMFADINTQRREP